MNLFRGFVPTKNKECLMKFKGKTDLLTLDEVEHLNEYAGILDSQTILIDVDDFEQSEILMDIVEDEGLACRVYKTSRGKHFLFKNTGVENCKTKTNLACGLVADIKIGLKNSYSVLKFDGKNREILYDKFDDEEYSEIPKYLLPIKSKISFLDMESGDGRNQALFNYILKLQSEGFTDDEARKCIKIINQYVLSESLEEREIETILRDEAFQKPNFFDGKNFLFDKFAMFLKNQYNIIKINGQLHVFDEGVYKIGEQFIESKMIKHIPNLNKQKRSEVMSYINLLVDKNSIPSSANFIAFKNGILNLSNGEIENFDHNIIITNKINFEYHPNAYSELGDKVLNKLSCNDAEIRALLEESIGYCLYRRSELRKSFILLGSKRGGKSTYLDIIKTMLGEENTCALDLKELGDRFKTAELFGKLANLGDDIGDEFIANPAIFKKLVSGDRVNAEQKGKNPFDFNNYAKLLFSANAIPRIKDKSGAVLDRLIIIPFNATFSKTDKDYNPHIKYELRNEKCMEYFVKLAVDGLKRVLENLNFTSSKKVQKELKEYEESNNPIILFFKENDVKTIENETTTWVFQKYNEFCLVNNFTPMSKIEFSKQVKKYYNLDTTVKNVNGKSIRIFVGGLT